jgi:putative ABC transport system permease protein
LFGVIAAGALVVPVATLLLMSAIERCARSVLSLPTLLAIRGVGASLSRTGVATAALAISVATVNGVGLMISSFRTSLADWLGTTLTADLYVNLDGADLRPTPDDIASIEGIDGVRGLSLTRTVIVPTAAGEIAVRGVRPGPAGWGFEIVSGDGDDARRRLAAGTGVIASERLAFARGLAVGDTISLPTPAGEKSLPVLATFRDFNTGAYSVVVSLDWLRREWNDSALTGIGVSLTEDADAANVQTALSGILGSPLRVRSTGAIRQASLRIFDRTFQITEVLRVLGGIVAFLGVLAALLSIELERARELAILRALGLGPKGLVATLLTQTSLLGLAAGLAAVPIGVALSALLVQVINRRSFGWSMELTVTPGPLLTGLALAIGAALLAGVYPAWRAIRTGLGLALREE